MELHPDHSPFIFWLLANNDDRKDPNPYPVPPAQRQLMADLANEAVFGIHPSYLSSGDDAKLKSEVDTFRSITGLAPRHSRQHFLRFTLPATYQQLSLQGITHDHSMGYADAIGWRAGTNLPYKWYDLSREEMTGLTIHPFAAMDVTLKNYLALSPENAVEAVMQLAASVRLYGGDFALLWHNSSFSNDFGWSGWQEVYEALVAKLVAAEE